MSRIGKLALSFHSWLVKSSGKYVLAPSGRIALQRIELELIFHNNHEQLCVGVCVGVCEVGVPAPLIPPPQLTSYCGFREIKAPHFPELTKHLTTNHTLRFFSAYRMHLHIYVMQKSTWLHGRRVLLEQCEYT